MSLKRKLKAGLATGLLFTSIPSIASDNDVIEVNSNLKSYFLSYDINGGIMRAPGIEYGYAIYSYQDIDSKPEGNKVYWTINTGFSFPNRDEIIDDYTPRVPIFTRFIWGDLINLEFEAGAVWGGINKELPESEMPSSPKFQKVDFAMGVGTSFQYDIMYLRFCVGVVPGQDTQFYMSNSLGFAL